MKLLQNDVKQFFRVEQTRRLYTLNTCCAWLHVDYKNVLFTCSDGPRQEPIGGYGTT